jgi:hypothetical protein
MAPDPRDDRERRRAALRARYGNAGRAAAPNALVEGYAGAPPAVEDVGTLRQVGREIARGIRSTEGAMTGLGGQVAGLLGFEEEAQRRFRLAEADRDAAAAIPVSGRQAASRERSAALAEEEVVRRSPFSLSDARWMREGEPLRGTPRGDVEARLIEISRNPGPGLHTLAGDLAGSLPQTAGILGAAAVHPLLGFGVATGMETAANVEALSVDPETGEHRQLTPGQMLGATAGGAVSASLDVASARMQLGGLSRSLRAAGVDAATRRSVLARARAVLGTAGREAAAQVPVESATEGAQQIVSNVTTGRPALEGAGESALLGGVMALGLTGGGSLAAQAAGALARPIERTAEGAARTVEEALAEEPEAPIDDAVIESVLNEYVNGAPDALPPPAPEPPPVPEPVAPGAAVPAGDGGAVAEEELTAPTEPVQLRDGSRVTLSVVTEEVKQDSYEGPIHTVTATDPETGEEVGRVNFSYDDENDFIRAIEANVIPAWQRRGVATAMYDLVERVTGKEPGPSFFQSDEGRAFWEARTARGAAAPPDFTETAPVAPVEAVSEETADVIARPEPAAPPVQHGAATLPPEHVPQRDEETGRFTPSPVASGAVGEMPIADLTTDPERFQPRDEAFSEESAANIAENFDRRELDPLRVWRDPKDGRVYVLAGHSRLQGQRRRAVQGLEDSETLPVQFYEGTEEEAVDFARRENDKGTAMRPHEQAEYVRGLIKQGRTKKEIRDRAQRLYGRNTNTVLALAALNPRGKALAALRAFSNTDTKESRDALTMATWVGKIRSLNPALTDSHETEIFNHLQAVYGRKDYARTADSYRAYVEEVIGRRSFMGTLQEGPLNFENVTPKSAQEQANEQQIKDAEKALADARRELETTRRSLVERGTTGEALERALKPYNEAVSYQQRELLALREEAGRAAPELRKQRSIFDELAELGATDEEARAADLADPETIERSRAAVEALEAQEAAEGASPADVVAALQELEAVVSELTGTTAEEPPSGDGAGAAPPTLAPAEEPRVPPDVPSGIPSGVPSGGETVGLNRAEITRLRSYYDLDELPAPNRRAFARALDDARGLDAAVLADELAAVPRPISDAEHAALVVRAADLQDRHDALVREIAGLVDRGQETSARALRATADTVLEALDRVTLAADAAGTAAGRALSIRRMRLRREDYTLASVLRQGRAEKGRKLSADEEARLTDLVAQLTRAEERAAELETKLAAAEAENARTEASRAARRLAGSKVAKERAQRDVAAAKEQLKALGFNVHSITGLAPEALFLVGKLASAHAREMAASMEGRALLDAVVDRTRAELPDLSEQDVWAALNAVDPKAREKAERAARRATERRLREIKTQARLLDAIAEAEAGTLPESRSRGEVSEEVRALQKRLLTLKLSLTRTETDGKRLGRIISQIEEAQAMLDEGWRKVKERREADPEEIREARQRLRDLRSLIGATDTITDLEERLRTGNIEVPAATVARVIPEELDRARTRVFVLRKKVRLAVNELKPRTPATYLDETLGLFRAIKATGDFSGWLRQGGMLAARRPGQALSAAGKSLKATISEEEAQNIYRSIIESENQYHRDKARLALTDLDGGLTTAEEHFASRWSRKLGVVTRWSERNMVTYLNLLRVAAFDGFLEAHPDATPEELRAWADFVNKATGRGDLQSFSAAGRILGLFFFAPRFTVSRIQAPLALFRRGISPRVRKEIAKDLVAYYGTASAALTLAALALAAYGDDDDGVGLDPRDSDFLKIRIGNQRIDILSGFAQPFRFLMGIFAQIGERAGVVGKKRGQAFSYDLLDNFFRTFGRYKVSPAVSLVNELVSGHDAIYRKIEPLGLPFTDAELPPVTTTLLRSITPLIAEETVDAYRAEGARAAAVAFSGSFVGLGVQTQDD